MRYHLNTTATLSLPTGFIGRLRGHFMPRPTPLVAEAVLDGPEGITPRIRLALDAKGRPEIVLGGHAAAPTGPTFAQFVRAEIREKGSGRPFRLRVRGETVAEVAEPWEPESVLTARITSVESATVDLGAAGSMTTANVGVLEATVGAGIVGSLMVVDARDSVVTGDLFDRLAVPRKGKVIAARDEADAGMARLEIMAQEADDEADRLNTAARATSSAKRERDYTARALEYTERARLLRMEAIPVARVMEWARMEWPERGDGAAAFIGWRTSSFGEYAHFRKPPWCNAITVFRDTRADGTPELCDGRVMLPHQLYRHTAAKMLEGYPKGTRLVAVPHRSAHRVWLPGDDASAG